LAERVPNATATFTEAEGAVTVLAAIEHCTAACVGIHVVKRATRFAGFSASSAVGLRLRHDHGSVYTSDDFQCEIQFLGIEPSPAFVRERFFRTLKEKLLWIHLFRNLVELCAALMEFRDRYNQQWILERLNYRTRVQARRDFQLETEVAA
jgi:transposase InsO family protein